MTNNFSTAGSTSHSAAISGLTDGATYNYYIKCQDSAGNANTDDYLISFSIALLPIPNSPYNLTANAVSASQVNLNWNDNSNNETGFKIERKTGVGGTYSQIAAVSANVTTYSDIGLSAATTYIYQVRTHNAGGNSAYSNESSATTLAASPVPGNPWTTGRVSDDAVKYTEYPSLAYNGTSFGVVWKDTRSANRNKETYFAKLNLRGQKEGVDVKVSNGEAEYAYPKIAWNGNDYGVFWAGGWAPVGASSTLLYRRVDSNGSLLGDITTLVSTSSNQDRTYLVDIEVVWTGDRYGIFWTKVDSVFGSRQEVYFFTADRFGTRLTPDLQLISELGGSSLDIQVAWNGNGYGLVYGTYFRRIDAAGNTLLGPVSLGLGRYPKVTWDGSGYGVTWIESTQGWSWPAKLVRVNQNGAIVMGPVAYTTMGNHDIEWNGSEYGILTSYRSDYSHSQMVLNTFSVTGAHTSQTQIAYYGMAWNGDLLFAGNKFAAVWQDTSDEYLTIPTLAGVEQ